MPEQVTTTNRSAGIAALTGDTLTLTAVGITASLIRVSVNVIDPQGNAGTIPIEQAATSNRTYPAPQAVQIQANTTIVSASAQVVTGTVPSSPGQIWVFCDLRRGGSPIAVVLAGYVYRGSNGPSFPGYPEGVLDSLNGRVYNVAPASPGAGAEISITVPSTARWRVYALQFTLVTSTVANNRTHHLTIDDGTTANKIFQSLGETPATVASDTDQFLYLPWYGTALETAYDANDFIRLPLPNPLILVGGARIKTVSTTLDAADQYTINQLWVEELFTG